MSLLRNFFDFPSRLAETGLRTGAAVLGGLQSALERATGTTPAATNGNPVDGPHNLDAAVSDLANRWLRLALATPLRAGELVHATRDAAEQARRSFAHLGARELLMLPLSLPLSAGTLACEQGLRALSAAQTVPPELLPDFVDYVTETFSDLHVFFSLQYQEKLEQLRARVAADPDDGQARLELGRTYLKCGLFHQARLELETAARFPAQRQRALYAAAVADYRSGCFAPAASNAAAALELEPTDERARWWLFLSVQKLGGYPAAIPETMHMEVRDGHHPAGLELESVAREIGLDKTSGARGTAIFDFDGDGHLDVAIAAAHAGVSLYRNNGDGTFTDVSTGSGLDRCVYGFGLCAGDFDGDGRDDLYVASQGFFNSRGSLFHNEGDGTFTDVTRDAGLDFWGPAFSASWVDYDNDGRLDLYVVHNLGGLFDRKTANKLFHNNGDGTFTDVTEEAGLRTPWPSLGSAWGDFRNCGLQDLFVSNTGHSQLFRNNGDGTFTDVSREAGVDRPGICSVAQVCDIDDDGWLDVVQFTYSRPQEAIYTLRHGEAPASGEPLRVYRNNRDGTFSLMNRELGLSGCWGTMSGAVADFDNDGHLDVFLGNGDPSMDRTEPAILYKNDGHGRFDNVSFAAGLPLIGKTHGVNLADLAGDGRMHLLMGAGGLYPGDLLTVGVYRPKERPGNYLGVRLTGTRSHRNAHGARLRLRAGGRDLHRLVSGGTNFGCQPLEQCFGLGKLAAIEELEIRWPSGLVERHTGLPINTTLRIVEGQAGWTEVYRRG